MKLVIVLVAASCLATGCTHLQLKRSTVGQARTLDDIYQQQVLDNLAKFAQNPNAMPSFAVPNEGNATVSDTRSGSPTVSWTGLGFEGAELGLHAERNIEQAWTMDPIRDPRKLALMRCAYQRAVAGTGPEAPNCSDCEARFTEFYKGHGSPAQLPGGPCWFRVGTKRDLPRDCSCTPVGHHCGVYVWVPPEGRDQLSRLTLAILDYAVFEPAADAVHTKSVTVYLNDKNAPTSADRASTVITAEVGIDEDLTEAGKKLLSGSGGEKVTPLAVPRTKSFGSGPSSLLQLRNQLRTITPRNR